MALMSLKDQGLSLCLRISAKILASPDPDPTVQILLNELRNCIEKMAGQGPASYPSGPGGGAMDPLGTGARLAGSGRRPDVQMSAEEVAKMKEALETMARLTNERAAEIVRLGDQVRPASRVTVAHCA